MIGPQELRRLSRARELLSACGEARLPLRRIARASGLSVSHFIRRFRAVFGETPHRFRIRARARQARELLLTTDASVTEISLRLGSSSLGSFSTRFAREVGVPPSRYRAIAGREPVEAFSCLGLMTGGPHP